MKKLAVALCLYFIALGVSVAQVCPGNITLSKQSEVNTFNCAEVTGNVVINGTGGDPITNLTPLSKLTTVGGNLQISGIDETDLNDLANLRTVVGMLSIAGEAKLSNITLSSLSSVGSFIIGGTRNTTIQSINLPLLTIVNGSYSVSNCDALTNINMSKLSTVKDNFALQGNDLLTQLNFSPVSVGGVNLTGNTSLSDCSALKNLLNTPGAIKTTPFFTSNKTNCNSKVEILNASPATNNALTFDGADDVIEAGIPSFYNNSFTIEGWIKPQPGAVLNIYQENNTAVYVEVTYTGTVRFVVRNTPANSGGVDIISKANVVTDGKWHHFAAVKGADDYLYLYIDGVQDIKSLGIVADFPATPFKMRLGMNVTDSPRYYKGSMDEIRCWNIARSQQDILANKDKTLTGNEQSLAVYYKFNQGTANGDNKTVATLTDTKGALNGNLQKFLLSGTTSNFTAGAPVQ